MFHYYGKRCFLSELWIPTGNTGHQMMRSRFEIEPARHVPQMYFVLMASFSNTTALAGWLLHLFVQCNEFDANSKNVGSNSPRTLGRSVLGCLKRWTISPLGRFLGHLFSLTLLIPITPAKAQISEPFVVLEERGAPGKIDISKVAQCLHLMLRELGLEGRQLPRMIVYHISEQSAQYLGIDGASIYRNTGSGSVRFEMWIVGKPSPYAYSYEVANVLSHHFHLTMDDEARSLAIKHVEQALIVTFDVRSLR